MTLPPVGGAPPQPTAPSPRPSPVDLVVVLVVTLVVMPVVLVGAFFVVGLTTMGTAGCGPGECVGAGPLLTFGLVAPPVLALLGGIAAVVQLARGRRAWPWAVVGAVVAAAVPCVVLAASFVVID